jgi:uncharacterized RDD family membrane protein YckC
MENEAPLPAEPASAAPAEIFLAGFWVRAGAFLIDSLIVALFGLIPVHGVGVLVGLAYKTIFISQGGQTPGKMAAGIKVLTATGEPVGVGRALARALSEYLSAILLSIGYLIAASSDKRALHDYIAGTRVIYVDGVGKGRKTAFAALGVFAVLLPIAAVVAMGILGVGTFGKFKTLSVKSGEGATKGNLGSLRSSLSIYYGDAEGQYPATLDALIGPKYLPAIPTTKLPNHKETSAWTAYGAEVCTGKTDYGTEIDASRIKDTGGWGYVADPKASCYGMVFVDCSHPDAKGKRWPEY